MQDFEPSARWRSYAPGELDRQYDARASVPSFEAEYARYVAESAPALADPRRIADLLYDTASGEKLDLYVAGKGSPLFVWIHGGYWRALSKADNAYAARGLLAKGVSVAVIDYTLAPAVTLDEIVRQVRSALAWLAHNGAGYGLDTGKLHIGGSSAGGHLAGMALAQGWHEAFQLGPEAIGTALALSGLFDIEPLIGTKVNGWMNLDLAAAHRNSPIRAIPRQGSARLIAAVGGLETDEFRRQTDDYARAFAAAGNGVTTLDMPGHNHFNIALDLAVPDGPLCTALLREIRR